MNELPFRQRIRAATQQTHQKLDDLIAGSAPFSSAGRYGFFLTNMLQVTRRGASSLQWAEQSIGLEPRTESLQLLLLEDIELSGGVIPKMESATTATDPRNDLTSTEKSAPALWGEAYVLAGSALGGSVMYGVARKTLPQGQSTRYLHQLSMDAKQRWPRFVKSLALEGAKFDESEAREAIGHANGLFEYAFELFSQTSDSR